MIIRESEQEILKQVADDVCGYCGEPVNPPVIFWTLSPGDALWLHAECGAGFALQLLSDAHNVNCEHHPLGDILNLARSVTK